MSALLEVRGLVKHFTQPRRWREPPAVVHAVDGVDFDVGRGESVGLVGESGSGKSTIARTLIGLHTATAGSIRFDGTELTGLGARGWFPFRRRIQMIFQDPYGSLDPRQSVLSILTEPMEIHGLRKPRERRLFALELLEAVGLNPHYVNRYPHEFSGGQRQRIAIARALAVHPELVICDEPVSALDVSVQAQVLNLLRELQQRYDIAYLFISHDLAVVRSLCERVVVLYLGRVAEIAPRDELFGAPRHPYTRALIASVPDPARAGRHPPVLLHGEPPSPTRPPSGCRFHPRCPERERVPDDRCAREEPAYHEQGTSTSACHLEDGGAGSE